MPRILVAPPEGWVALSIRQPWAALIVAGVKSIEIRSWKTRRRGPVLIHAGKSPDHRPQGWKLIDSPDLQRLAELRGGIIGVACLTHCKSYLTRKQFLNDRMYHLAELSWFKRQPLFGHVFSHVRPVPYVRCPGQMWYFAIKSLNTLAPT